MPFNTENVEEHNEKLLPLELEKVSGEESSFVWLFHVDDLLGEKERKRNVGVGVCQVVDEV